MTVSKKTSATPYPQHVRYPRHGIELFRLSGHAAYSYQCVTIANGTCYQQVVHQSTTTPLTTMKWSLPPLKRNQYSPAACR